MSAWTVDILFILKNVAVGINSAISGMGILEFCKVAGSDTGFNEQVVSK